jgi:excisionase family DNA binding protein
VDRRGGKCYTERILVWVGGASVAFQMVFVLFFRYNTAMTMNETSQATPVAALLTSEQVAEQLHVCAETVRRMIAAGLPAVDICLGGERPRWRVRQSDLDAWMAARTIARSGESA